MIEKTEIRIRQIIEDFKARQTGLVTKNNQLQALADERHRKLLLLEQEKRDMFRIIKELREQVAQTKKRTQR